MKRKKNEQRISRKKEERMKQTRDEEQKHMTAMKQDLEGQDFKPALEKDQA
jgi:hypothetical protein